MKTLDCRAHKCPHPVVETRKLILAEPGAPLTVLVGDEAARENVSRMAVSQGYQARVSPTEGGFALELIPGDKPQAGQPEPATGKTVAFIAADQMGSGDPELGRILLKNLLFTMAESATPPDTLLFVNAGVKLTVAGSEVLEPLEKLVCMGVDVASCGLCLDFFHMKDKLTVGRVTNMVEILDSMQNAGRVIRP
jgi:selenium metabolism protein YedF